MVNATNLHLKSEYGARSESRFACYSHCYVTWRPLTTGIVASQCPTSRGAALVTNSLITLILACLNPLKSSTTIKHITNNLQTKLKAAMLLLTPLIAEICHLQCEWLAFRVLWHAPSFVTHVITLRREKLIPFPIKFHTVIIPGKSRWICHINFQPTTA